VCACLSRCQKLIISSLHHILHSPGRVEKVEGWTHSGMSFVRPGPGVCPELFTTLSPPTHTPLRQRAVRSSLELILVGSAGVHYWNATVAGFVGEDAERCETDGVSRGAAGLGEDAGIDGRRRQDSVVVQAVDCSVGKVHRPARQLVFDEWVR